MCPPTSITDRLATPDHLDKWSYASLTKSLPSQLQSSLPPHKLVENAINYATDHLHPAIFNHSLRVFFYAHVIAVKLRLKLYSGEDVLYLFVACIMHDIGTSHAHDGDERFEVAGADAAVTFLRQNGFTDREAGHNVWTAIAVHTCSGIAERINEMSLLLRVAVLIDFGQMGAATRCVDVDRIREVFTAEQIDEHRAVLENALPRLDAEKILGDAVVKQAIEKKHKAPVSTWPGGLLRARLNDRSWRGVDPAF